jgi:hypothetical protein
MSGSSPVKESQRSRVRMVIAILLALTLFALYLYFLDHFYPSLILVPMTAIEAAIFYTMILRTLGFAFIPLLRRQHPQTKILVFSLEAFVLCILIIMIALTSEAMYRVWMDQVLTVWIGATLIVLTPYSILELAVLMYKGPGLTSLVFSVAPLSAITLFLANLIVRVPNLPVGLANFGTAIIDSLRGEPSLAGGVGPGSSVLIPGISIVIFILMVVYIALIQNWSAPALTDTPKYHYALALMLIGSLVLYFWLFGVAPILKENIVTIFSIPATIIPVVILVITRHGKKTTLA